MIEHDAIRALVDAYGGDLIHDIHDALSHYAIAIEHQAQHGVQSPYQVLVSVIDHELTAQTVYVYRGLQINSAIVTVIGTVTVPPLADRSMDTVSLWVYRWSVALANDHRQDHDIDPTGLPFNTIVRQYADDDDDAYDYSYMLDAQIRIADMSIKMIADYACNS